MTDPTPRTAATARDALVAKVTGDWDADPYGEYEAARSRLIADLDNLIALAAAEAPGRVAALVEELRPNCGKLRNLHGPLMGLGYAAALDDILAAPAAPAPTPSEPVGRVDGAVLGHICADWCEFCDPTPCDATMLCPYPQGHPVHAEDGDHPFTPATRDE